jgi:hypothetical protein
MAHLRSDQFSGIENFMDLAGHLREQNPPAISKIAVAPSLGAWEAG